jgi:uncharacterized repeat protein (TIGR03803 family)
MGFRKSPCAAPSRNVRWKENHLYAIPHLRSGKPFILLSITSAAIALALLLTSRLPAAAQCYQVIPLASFNSANNGYYNCNGVTLGSDGNLYAAVQSGGPGGGAIMEYSAAGGLQAIAPVTNPAISPIVGPMTTDGNGNFYGVSGLGGSSNPDGGVFQYSASGGLQELAQFNGTSGYSGYNPFGIPLLDGHGGLYGTTVGNPSWSGDGAGNIFHYTPSGGLQSLASFNGTNGYSPDGGLVEDTSGNLYGTTNEGGSTYTGQLDGKGAFFEYSASGGLQALASFTGENGEEPVGQLVTDGKGHFYGVTEEGGSSYGLPGDGAGFGTLFEYSAAGGLKTLVSFTGPNGNNPLSGLVMDSAGNIYGATTGGGANGGGTLFEYSASGVFSTLTSFASLNPSSLILDGNGGFYGTSFGGGTYGDGEIFHVVPVVTPSPDALPVFAFGWGSLALAALRRRIRSARVG